MAARQTQTTGSGVSSLSRLGSAAGRRALASLPAFNGALAFMAAFLLCVPAVRAASLDVIKKEGYKVNVIVRDETVPLRIRPAADYVVYDGMGEPRLRLKKDETVRLAAGKVPEPPQPYTIVIRAFDQFNKSEARRCAEDARKRLKMEARVGRLDPGAWPGLTDRPYGALAVCVGNYDARADAAADLNMVTARFPLGRIMKPKANTLPRALIQVLGSNGAILGIMCGPLTITPLNTDPARNRVCVGAVRTNTASWIQPSPQDIVCPGELIFDVDARYHLLAINRTHVDDYLRGVVASEIGSAPLEALKAQAIASRSEALAKVDSGRYLNPLYDLCATQLTQVYQGNSASTVMADQAVRETAGLVMLHDGGVVEAVFSANCGGVTASSEDVWDGKALPYLRGKVDTQSEPKANLQSVDDTYKWLASLPKVYSNPFGSDVIPEREQGYFRWRQRMTIAELARSLKGRYDVGAIKDIRVVERSSTGRVKGIEIAGDKKTVRITGYTGISNALANVNSTFFVISHERDAAGRLQAIILYGAGHGHGVGMCQTGARQMAAQGRTSTEILKHYYSNVTIASL